MILLAAIRKLQHDCIGGFIYNTKDKYGHRFYMRYVPTIVHNTSWVMELRIVNNGGVVASFTYEAMMDENWEVSK